MRRVLCFSSSEFWLFEPIPLSVSFSFSRSRRFGVPLNRGIDCRTFGVSTEARAARAEREQVMQWIYCVIPCLQIYGTHSAALHLRRSARSAIVSVSRNVIASVFVFFFFFKETFRNWQRRWHRERAWNAHCNRLLREITLRLENKERIETLIQGKTERHVTSDEATHHFPVDAVPFGKRHVRSYLLPPSVIDTRRASPFHGTASSGRRVIAKLLPRSVCSIYMIRLDMINRSRAFFLSPTNSFSKSSS